jgi:hypothetical protein
MENHNVRLSEIGADDFARRFSLRAANLMWFLGAGASAAAGIPTAFDMVWEFKQQLFISQRRISPKLVADLASPTIRAQLQAHIDSLGALPSAGAADEYARLFETVYPAEADRRAYLEAKIAGLRESRRDHLGTEAPHPARALWSRWSWRASYSKPSDDIRDVFLGDAPQRSH